MNIYLIERTDNVGWDAYFGGVFFAETEDEAWHESEKELGTFGGWTSRNNVRITKIGMSPECKEPGLILDSFNAG